jgi:P27 family predicted phage terminase small subunit
MGRRKEPLERAALKARGDGRTPGGRELVPAQFTIAKRTDAPRMPRGLKTRGKREWLKIWDSGPWLNPDHDYAWVEQVARAYDDIDVYRARIEQDGLVVNGSLGQPVAHPLVAEIRKCEQTIRQCLSVLGFSPTDRARLGLAEVKRVSALQDMIAKSNQR